jgi:predicted ribosomally synthesized peptide with SipW-like signal peptide
VSNKRKLLLSALVLGLAGAIGGAATFSAFSSSTTNTGNQFAAGTVVLADNDAGAAMYSISNTKPGVNTVKCIQVTYTGSLDADVKLYTTTTTIPAAAANITLTVEKGTATGGTGFPDCGTYTSGATIYSGSLYDFQQNKGSYTNGVAANPGAATKWVTNDALVYRFTLAVNDSGSGVNSGSHQFTWEARNQ